MATAACIPPGVARDIAGIVAPAQSRDGILAAEMVERVREDRNRVSKPLEFGYEVLSNLNIVRHAPLTTGPKIWNLADVTARIKAAATKQGIDFGRVLDAAAKNFTSPTLSPDTSMLTPEEIDAVVEHDNKSLEG